MFALLASPAYAKWCAAPGRDGSAALSGVVNTYYPGTQSAAAGSTSIRVSAGTGAGQPIATGDLLLVIQMIDATIATNDNSRYGDGVNGGLGNGYSGIRQTGLYEFVRATSAVPIGGGTFSIVGATGGGLINQYNRLAASDTGKRTFQVIRVPQYDEATIAGTVSALPWNGAAGGVVVLDVARRLTFAGGAISADGLGFRGGGGRAMTGGAGTNADFRTLSTNNAHGSKGEGVAGTPRYVNNQGALQNTGFEGYANGSYARGAPGNAGGGGNDGNPAANNQNSGGGGGANVGAGGIGGHAWCASGPGGCPQSGGHPGAFVAEVGFARIVLGGGGGAGVNNNGSGVPGAGFASSGGAGGGIVIVRAGEIAGAGTISANGADANSTVTTDGSGGGGAGGAVLLAAARTVAGTSISVNADGGDGGSNTGGGVAHGPGGGGGGGFIASTIAIASSVLGGNAGTTQNGGAFGPQYGAQAGNGGAGTAILAANIPGLSSGGECTPIVRKSFASSPIMQGATTRMNVVITNYNPTLPLVSASFTDNYPAGLVNAASPAEANSCAGGTLNAPAGGGSFAVSGATIAAASSCTFSVNTTANSAGDKTNNIPAGALTGSYSGLAVASLADAAATVVVLPPLIVSKSSTVLSDPQNGSTEPKAIPGAFISYSVSVENPGAYSVDSDSIVVIDATPPNLRLVAADVAPGSGPVLFQDGSPSSGLSYSFSSLDSMSDDLEFSNNGGSSWSYIPAPDAQGADPNVTHMRVQPKGSMAGSSSFTLLLRYVIR